MLWHYLPCRRWLRGYMTQWNSPCLKDLCQQRLWKQCHVHCQEYQDIQRGMLVCQWDQLVHWQGQHCRRRCQHDHRTEDNETSLSTDKANTVDEEDNQAEVTPKPIRALLCCQFKRSVLWSVCGFGLYRTAEVILVSSFAVCTAVQDAVMTNEHKNRLGRGPSYSMMIKMMVPRIFGVDTIHFDLYPGTHPAGML
jgi:hypothetical protein